MIPRWAILRGDAAALAVALLGLGAVLLALAAGTADVAEGAAGVASLVAGGVLLRAARAAWRAEITRVAALFADQDPGQSPVPWVADAVWRDANRFDPELDAINELVAEIDPSVPRFAQSARGGLEGPTLRLVQDAERAIAPEDRASATPDDASTPTGTLDVLLAALQSTPGRLLGVSVRWPVCCGGLTVLTGRDPSAPMQGAIALGEGADAAQANAPASGAAPTLPHRFRCPRCGRRYATEPVWGP